MRLREVVFQGVFGLTRAVRIRVESGFCNLKLPEGIEPAEFTTLLDALLFPNDVGEDQLRPLVDGDGSALRLGAIVEVDKRRKSVYKIFRRLEDDSIVVNDVTTPGEDRTLATGAPLAARLMEQRVFLPPYADFQLVHGWRHPGGGPAAPEVDVDPDEGEAARLKRLYKNAVAIEAIERQMDEVRADINEAERELKRAGGRQGGAAVADAQRREQEAIDALSDEDLAFIEAFERVASELDERKAALKMELEESGGRSGGMPPILKDYMLWGPAAGGFALFVLSALIELRALALLNIILFGVSTSSLLKRLTAMEKASFGERRKAQLEQRLEAADQEREALGARMESLLVATASSDLGDLRRRIAEREGLDEELELLADAEGSDELTAHIESIESQLDGLRRKMRGLEVDKEDIHDSGMASWELEQALQEHGVDPYALADEVEASGRGGDPMAWFAPAQKAAAARGLFVMGRLVEKARGTWSKLAAHLVGGDWHGVGLSAEGELQPPPAIGEGWQERLTSDPQEARLLAWSLLGAIVVATAPGHPLNQCRFLCLTDPFGGLSPQEADRLKTVLKSLASRAHVVVLRRSGS